MLSATVFANRLLSCSSESRIGRSARDTAATPATEREKRPHSRPCQWSGAPTVSLKSASRSCMKLVPGWPSSVFSGAGWSDGGAAGVAGSSAAKGSPALPERRKTSRKPAVQVLETEDRFERFTEHLLAAHSPGLQSSCPDSLTRRSLIGCARTTTAARRRHEEQEPQVCTAHHHYSRDSSRPRPRRTGDRSGRRRLWLSRHQASPGGGRRGLGLPGGGRRR